MQLYKYEGPSKYDLVLGWRELQSLSLDLQASTHCFQLDGYPLQIYNDHGKKDAIVGNILTDKETNLAPMQVLAHDSITLRRNDECQIVLVIKDEADLITGADVGDVYILELTQEMRDLNIELASDIVELFRLNERKKPLGSMIYLRVPEDHAQPFISTSKDQLVGTLRPILAAQATDMANKNPEAVQVVGAYFVNNAEEAEEIIKTQNEQFQGFKRSTSAKGTSSAADYFQKNPNHHFDSIVIFPIKREMTDEEIKEMEDAAIARETEWTRENVAEVFKKTLDHGNQELREEKLDFLYQHRRAFASNPVDIKYHCSTVQFDAYIPNSLSIHVAPKYSGMMTKLINGRMQQCMLDRNQLEVAPADGIKCSHRFISVKKPNQKVPLNKEALDEMKDDEVYTSYRAVLDVSALSKYTNRTCSSSPMMAEALARKPWQSITTYLDISAFFYQLRITPKLRALFCFEADIPGVNWLWLKVLSQGAQESSRLAQNAIRKIVDALNGIEPRKNFGQFIEDLEKIEQDKPIHADQDKLLPLAHLTFIDDIALSSPRDPVDLVRLDLREDSYWHPPMTERQKVVFIRLNMGRFF